MRDLKSRSGPIPVSSWKGSRDLMAKRILSCRATIPTRAESSRLCTAADCGQCVNMLDLDPLPKQIDGSNTFLPMDKRDFPSLSICRHRWDWIRITRLRLVKLGKWV